MVGWVSGFVSEWVSEWVSGWVRGSVQLYLVDTIATTVFAQSLSNFTCSFTMMRGRTLLILGHGVKGQGQLWHLVYKTLWTRYRLQFLPNHFQTSHVSCGWWEEEPYWFWVTGSKVKVNFGTLCIRPCGHDSDYSFCPITFKFHMHIYLHERRNPIDLGSKVKVNFGSLCIRPYGHNTDYSLSPITFKLNM